MVTPNLWVDWCRGPETLRGAPDAHVHFGLDFHGSYGLRGANGFTSTAPVATVQDHARLIGKAAVGTFHCDGLVGAFLDASGAFASLRQETEVQVHDGPANHALPLVRQRQPGDGTAGANLVAAMAIFAAVIPVEQQSRRQESRHAAGAEVGLDDIRGTDLGAVATAHAHAGKPVFVQ